MYLTNVQTLERLETTLFCNDHTGSGSEREDCYGTFEKLIRNSEYSKTDNLKKLSVLGPNSLFLMKIHVF